MTDLQIIHGSDYALRHDGPGADPVDGRHPDAWVMVLRLVDGDYAPCRRFPTAKDATAYVAAQNRS